MPTLGSPLYQRCLQSNCSPSAVLDHIHAGKPIVTAVVLTVLHPFLDRTSSHNHCYSPGAAAYWSATAISHALEALGGQFDWVQRSLVFVYVRLEHGSHQLYISPILATRVKR